jgi:hypothetical protein
MAIATDGTVVVSPGGIRPAGSTYTIDPGKAHDFKSTISLVSCDTNSGLCHRTSGLK